MIGRFAGIWAEFAGERGTKAQAGSWPPLGLRLSDHLAEWRGRTDPPKAIPVFLIGRKTQRLASRALERSQGIATAATRRSVRIVARGTSKEDQSLL